MSNYDIDFSNMNVYASFGYNGYARPLITYGANLVDHIEDANILLLGGGEDINPELYGAPKGYRTWFNSRRDAEESKDIKYAMQMDIPIVGICRGMQMLTAATGGYLIQDVTSHAGGGGHSVETIDGSVIKVNSLHHQMCVPNGGEALAWSFNISKHYLNGDDVDIKDDLADEFGDVRELEAIYFNSINSLGVQWHPEMMSSSDAGQRFFVESINKYIWSK